MSTIKPTIYLVKEDVKDPKDIFKVSRLQKVEKNGFVVYYKKSNKNTPDWAYFLNEQFDVNTSNFENSSSFAVLTIVEKGRLFAIPLGMGIHLLDMTKIEYNFGLRAAINGIPKTEIRQIDTTKPDLDSQKTRKAAVKGTTPEDFEINKEKDILRGIVGKIPADLNLGEVVEGRDSLRVTKATDSLLKLASTVKGAYKLYQSTTYKKDYPWIDNMALLRDKSKIEALQKLLAKELKSGKLDELYFIPPVFFGDDLESLGFKFSTGDRTRISGKELYVMPSMIDWKDEIGKEERKKITFENIDSFKVHEIKEGDKERSWPLYRCLSWETTYNGQKYIFSEGSWYEISTSFYEEVNGYFNARVVGNTFPTPSKSKIKESDYNKELSESLAQGHLFDLGHEDSRKRSLGKDRNEACDVFDANTNTFIHVKIGKSSSNLSHLFAQGGYSGIILKQEDKILDEFNKHITADNGTPLKKPFYPSDYTVLFVSVIGKRQKKDIPFFSKVTFYNIVRKSLDFGGYKCGFTYVVLPQK
ncbi:DUF6119 family protein [Sphingobacterium siyangense]|jgi:uncharacterized protein (TIGR04141 family)|uniref:DUF6119 family protein n=1 Tax=Sphingobacterium siyangense TaxID=459529 RepID=UPI0028A7E66C|nr:DUF6119 family protein [Sphingobacterium siyangense]